MATWFVLCSADKAVPMKEVHGKLSKLPKGAEAKLSGDSIVIDYAECQVSVGFEKGRKVAAEARDIAADHGSDRKDMDAIAQLDARYNLLYDAAEADRVFNVLASVSGTLEKLTGGVIFDADNTRFV